MTQLAIHTYGSGTPIVFLHGWGFDSQIWSELLPDLLLDPTKYQIFLVDLPGFGASPSMSWTDFKSKLLDNLPSQFILLGWSLGGLYATRLASEEPQRIKHLIQIASSPYFLKTSDWAGISPESLDDFYLRFAKDPKGTREQFVQSQLVTTMPNYPDLSIVAMDKSEDVDGLKEGLSILKQWDLRDNLAQLSMPVSYLFGRLDRIVPHHTYHVMHAAYPEFHYTLFPKSGHMPFLSHKKEFLDWLQDVLCLKPIL
ncbi:MAG: alpha/beta fold hydrolase [Gammaproteobacteria bacterium]